MPQQTLKNFAKEYDVPPKKVKEFEKTAKEQYGDDWEKVIGSVKKMCKNYQKSMKESTEPLNNFQKTILVLQGKTQLTESKSYDKIVQQATQLFVGKELSKGKRFIDPETAKVVTGIAIFKNGDIWVTEDSDVDGTAKWNPYDVKPERRFK
jgi:esterase/lipase